MAALDPAYFDSIISKPYRGSIQVDTSTGTGTGGSTTDSNVNSYNKDTFMSLIKKYLFMDESDPDTQKILDEFWNAYDTKYKNEPISLNEIPDLIVGTSYTPVFSEKYKAYIDIRKDKNNITGITSLKEFNAARLEYKQLLKAYGLSDIATNENADKFLVGNISADEAGRRLQAAYDAINNADTFLKQQMDALNLSGTDLARALILGKEGAIELQNKIKTANILAAEAELGYKSTLDARTLALTNNITREEARRAFSKTKQELGSYTTAAERAGISTADLQKELESENVLGMASQRRKKIQAAEQNLFSGTSGTFAGSLGSKMAAGQI